MIRSSKTAFALLLSTSLALPAIAAERVPLPDPEQGDGRVSEFYTWGGDIPAKPGTLLRSEELPDTIGLANAGKQLRILYSSTDGVHGSKPNVVSGALFIPKGKAPAGGWPVIAWAHGTVGVADICAPSWAGRSYRDTVYLNQWLSEGYAIVATDYQGLGVPGPHPLINIPALSYGVLDSIRAVVGVENIANKAVIVGQSQGGAAAFGAAAYAATYAPDVALKGAVGTGVIYRKPAEPSASGTAAASSILPSSLHKVDDSIVYSLFGFLISQQHEPRLQYSDVFTEKAIPLARQARTTCLPALANDLSYGAFTRAETFLEQPSQLYREFQAGDEARARRYSYYPTLKLSAPIFIGTGASDLTPSAVSQLALMKDACAAGSIVEGHIYAGLGHSATVNASLKDSLPFVRKVFAGEKIEPICSPEIE